MPRIFTLGRPRRRKQFIYTGTLQTGLEIHYSSFRLIVTPRFLQAMLAHFHGQLVDGGFSRSRPIHGGVGEWIENNSRRLNGRKISAQYGSRIIAVLDDLRLVGCGIHDQKVVVYF